MPVEGAALGGVRFTSLRPIVVVELPGADWRETVPGAEAAGAALPLWIGAGWVVATGGSVREGRAGETVRPPEVAGASVLLALPAAGR